MKAYKKLTAAIFSDSLAYNAQMSGLRFHNREHCMKSELNYALTERAAPNKNNSSFLHCAYGNPGYSFYN